MTLKEYMKKKSLPKDYCKGCFFFGFFYGLYDFVESSRRLKNDEYFNDILDTYSKLMSAYFEVLKSGDKDSFNQDYYDYFYLLVTTLILKHKKKLHSTFPKDFAEFYRVNTLFWGYCGGILPACMVRHREFNKSME